MMRITLKLFAILRDKAGVSELSLDIPEASTAAAVIDRLAEAYPNLKALLPQSRVAVNRAYASDDTVLADEDEVALIPPVSGG